MTGEVLTHTTPTAAGVINDSRAVLMAARRLLQYSAKETFGVTPSCFLPPARIATAAAAAAAVSSAAAAPMAIVSELLMHLMS